MIDVEVFLLIFGIPDKVIVANVHPMIIYVSIDSVRTLFHEMKLV